MANGAFHRLLAATLVAGFCAGCRTSGGAPTLEDVVARFSPDEQHYHADRDFIRRAGEPALPLLTRALFESNPPGRLESVATLMAEIDPDRGSAVLLRMLQSQDPRVRVRALQCCFAFGGSHKLRLAVLNSARDSDPSVRVVALLSIRPGESPKAMVIILDALRKGGQEAVVAAFQLALDHDRRALPALRMGLHSANPVSRRSAVLGIVELGKVDVRRELSPVVDDPDPQVREMARRAIAGRAG